MLPTKFEFKNDLPSFTGPPHYCATCGHELSSEIYVSCTLCKDIDLCLPCFSQGPNIRSHFKEHPFAVIMPTTQKGFEIGWTLQEELVLIESLSKGYSFDWNTISEQIRTKKPDECRRHFYKCYIKAIKAPDPRGGSSLDYSNSNFPINPNENTLFTGNQDVIPEQPENTNTNLIPESNELVTSSTNPSESFFPNTDQQNQTPQQQHILASSSLRSNIAASSIFSDNYNKDESQYNKHFRGEKKVYHDKLTKGDFCGYIPARKEFEIDLDEIPEIATLDIYFNEEEEEETEESFMKKLEILRSYDSIITDRIAREEALSKLQSFKDYISQPTNVDPDKKSNPSFQNLIKAPISNYSSIAPENFGLIGVAEDPNDIERVSSIIQDAKSTMDKYHINPRIMSSSPGTQLHAALFQKLTEISIIEKDKKKDNKKEGKRKKGKTEQHDQEDNNGNEIEQKSQTEINENAENEQKEQEEENTKSDEASSLKKKSSSDMNIQKSNFIRKPNQKEKKSKSSTSTCLNINEKSLRQWNENVPLAKSSNLFDSFYLSFLSESEINFINVKKISASLFWGVKSEISQFIIGGFDDGFIYQKLKELYPNYLVEATLIKDYLVESKIFK